jgi:hypothetical protein
MRQRSWGIGWFALLGVACSIGQAQPAADALRAEFATLQATEIGRVVDRPLYLRSSDSAERMQGEIHALVQQPYPDLRRELARPDSWCSILILHLNIKYCRTVARPDQTELVAGMGRKVDQPLADAYWLRLSHRVDSADDDYFRVSLLAPSGPMGTTDYRIVVQAVPYSKRQTLLQLSYAYSFGASARLAMQIYLSSFAREKVGFSIVGRAADGQPVHVDGVRGVLERNTMRYYLAIESYLGAANLPPSQREQKSLQDWFDATERYARQLHELDRSLYLEMKERELRRQETERPPQIAP